MLDGSPTIVLEPPATTPAAAAAPREIRPLIDGRHTGGSGQALTLFDPATGQVRARLASAGPADVDAAVASAALNATMWRCLSFAERAAKLRRLERLIEARAASIAEAIAREQGKPSLEALTLEVLPALDHLRFIGEHAGRYHGGVALDPRHRLWAHKRSQYLYDPLGVIAVITPSPLPFAAPLIQMAAAVAMGNAVVLKPSEWTPACAVLLGELCLEAGFPNGLVNVVPALPEDTLRLVTHPRVDKVFFTGRLDAGQIVMTAAGCRPRPVVLALGGKHPAIVAGDADIDRAARGIVWGALANAGQNFGSIERVYVEERVAARFIERLLDEVDRVRMGAPLDLDIELGPLVSAERRQEVDAQVQSALAAGARLLRGGAPAEGPGFYYPPTVLLGAPSDSRLMREETLGPVIPIVIVDTLERAILLANDSDYALTASGWTGKAETAERLMVGLQASVVTINDVLYAFDEPGATWAGHRHSGLGHRHGSAGLREMCRQRFVSHDAASSESPLFAFPYDALTTRLARRAIDLLHGGSRWRRLKGRLGLIASRRLRARMPLGGLLFSRRRH